MRGDANISIRTQIRVVNKAVEGYGPRSRHPQALSFLRRCVQSDGRLRLGTLPQTLLEMLHRAVITIKASQIFHRLPHSTNGDARLSSSEEWDSVSIRLFWTFLFGFGFFRRRLMLLYLLLLRCMPLLKLLRLLSVPLFHLLFLCVVGIFLRSLLVFLFLLLLEFLVFLILFGGKLFLLLLVFLVRRGIAGVGRRVGMRL
jgi:hypothetical protein